MGRGWVFGAQFPRKALFHRRRRRKKEWAGVGSTGAGLVPLGGPKNKMPRDSLRVREAHKTINPEG